MAKVFLVPRVERSSSPQVKLIIFHMKDLWPFCTKAWSKFCRHYEVRGWILVPGKIFIWFIWLSCRQDECPPRGRPPAWPLPLSRPAVWQGAEILKYFLQKFLFVKCNLDQQCGYKVCKCPGQKCGKVPKCQNCFFFNKSNLGNATKVLKFKKQGQQGVETIWTKLVMQMMIDTFDTFPAALIQKYLNLAFDFVDFCLSTFHIFICWHLCSQVFSSKNKQTSHYSK